MATEKKASSKKRVNSKKKETEEPAWTYRGYKLKASEFVTAMVHLFRAEIQRANVWRQRLDTTTNWAVVAKEDPQAFVIVSPTQEILGCGFNLFEKK